MLREHAEAALLKNVDCQSLLQVDEHIRYFCRYLLTTQLANQTLCFV
jgi:hypothetical protein